MNKKLKILGFVGLFLCACMVLQFTPSHPQKTIHRHLFKMVNHLIKNPEITEDLLDFQPSFDKKGVFFNTSTDIYYYDFSSKAHINIYKNKHLGNKFGVIDQERLFVFDSSNFEVCIWNFKSKQVEGCQKTHSIEDRKTDYEIEIKLFESDSLRQKWLILFFPPWGEYAVLERQQDEINLLIEKDHDLTTNPTKMALSNDGNFIAVEYFMFEGSSNLLDFYFTQGRLPIAGEKEERDYISTIQAILYRRLNQFKESGKFGWNYKIEDLQFTGLLYGGQVSEENDWGRGDLEFDPNDENLIFIEKNFMHLIDIDCMEIVNTIELPEITEDFYYSNIMVYDEHIIVRTKDGCTVLLFIILDNQLYQINTLTNLCDMNQKNNDSFSLDNLAVLKGSDQIILGTPNGFYQWDVKNGNLAFFKIKQD